jgi:hypothetical protein
VQREGRVIYRMSDAQAMRDLFAADVAVTQSEVMKEGKWVLLYPKERVVMSLLI